HRVAPERHAFGERSAAARRLDLEGQTAAAGGELFTDGPPPLPPALHHLLQPEIAAAVRFTPDAEDHPRAPAVVLGHDPQPGLEARAPAEVLGQPDLRPRETGERGAALA